MIIWRDGAFVPGRDEQPLPQDPWTLPGVFETLLHNGRSLCRVRAHLDRLARGLAALGREMTALPDADQLQGVVEHLREGNQWRGPARVNVFCPLAGCWRVAVVVRPMALELDREYRLWPVVGSPHAQARIKRLQRGDLDQARLHAVERGADDALLVDEQGRVLETGCAAVLMQQGRRLVAPQGPLLESTALDALCRARDFPAIARQRVTLAQLGRADHLWLLNSLRGLRPVVGLGKAALRPGQELARAGTRLITGMDGQVGASIEARGRARRARMKAGTLLGTQARAEPWLQPGTPGGAESGSDQRGIQTGAGSNQVGTGSAPDRQCSTSPMRSQRTLESCRSQDQ